MDKRVKTIRQLIASKVTFKFWVRSFGIHAISCGPSHGSQKRCDEMTAILRSDGYKTQMIGKPGTEGQWIIDIVSLPE